MSEKAKSITEMMDELFKRMERSLDEILRTGFLKPSFDVKKCCLEPLVDMTETTEEIIVTFDLPFIQDKNDIEIKATAHSLEIDAKFKEPIRFKNWGTVQKDTEFKHFHYTIRKLPTEVIAENATSRFKQGLIEIKLPKIKPYKIKIE